MQLKTTILLTVRDSATARIVAQRSFLARSYLRSFLDGLYCHVTQTTHSIQDVTGAWRSVTPHTFYMNANCPANYDTHGIVIGIGTSEHSLEWASIQSKINHGPNGGEMLYGVSQKVAPFWPPARYAFNAHRDFTNNSGASITVNECGIYVSCTTTPYYFCIVRDLISPGQPVPNLSVLNVKYEIAVEL